MSARAHVAQTMGGQWVKADKLHITLAFLGDIARERWPEIARTAETMAVPEFTLMLDRAEFWPRNGIVCLGASAAPKPLLDLAQGLTRGLGAAGFALEARPYRVHLSLARKGYSERKSLVLPSPVAWRVDAFSLVESRLGREGSAYTPRQTWRLQKQNSEAIPGLGSVG